MGMTKRTGIMLADDLKVTIADMKKVMKQLKITKKMNEYLYPYKIASFELVDIPLIEYTASKGKPMIISCGMGSVEEIGEALEACRRVGNNQVVLLKCCSEYPANWDDMYLGHAAYFASVGRFRGYDRVPVV